MSNGAPRRGQGAGMVKAPVAVIVVSIIAFSGALGAESGVGGPEGGSHDSRSEAAPTRPLDEIEAGGSKRPGREEAVVEKVLAAAVVPSEESVQGEVRHILRGETKVVQTFLYSRLLKRVVAEIAKKESVNWPQGHPGHEDSRNYVEALWRAHAEVWKRFKLRRDRRERRQMMVIELTLDDERSAVDFFYPVVEKRHGSIRLGAKDPIERVALSREYVRRNMDLILGDSVYRDVDDGKASHGSNDGG
ncbi:MAG: hypothetical protein ACE5E4_07625 [Candidatus Binatia bacterium]